MIAFITDGRRIFGVGILSLALSSSVTYFTILSLLHPSLDLRIKAHEIKTYMQFDVYSPEIMDTKPSRMI